MPWIVAHQPLDALCVVDAAHLGRAEHDAGSAVTARALIRLERPDDVVVAEPQCLAQRHRVLQRRARTLPHGLGHWVSGMTEQTDSVDAWPLYRRGESCEPGRRHLQAEDLFGEQPDRNLVQSAHEVSRHFVDRQVTEQPGGRAAGSGLHVKDSRYGPLERVHSPIGGETPEQGGPYDQSSGRRTGLDIDHQDEMTTRLMLTDSRLHDDLQAVDTDPQRLLRQALSALDRAEQDASPTAVISALTQAAQAYRGLGAPAIADWYLRKAIAAARAHGTVQSVVSVLCASADLAAAVASAKTCSDNDARRAARERARDQGFEAALLAAQSEDTTWEIDVLMEVSDVLDRCGDHDDAVALQCRVLELINRRQETMVNAPASAGAAQRISN